MEIPKFILWNVVILLTIFISRGIGSDEAKEMTSGFEIFPGFRLLVQENENEIDINLDLRKMFPVSTEIEERNTKQDSNNENDKHHKQGIMQRFGTMLVMIPLIMQMFSLPGAIATIKMSLLKSIFVAKLALLVILVNALRNQQPSEIVVVHQSPAQHHDHFYPHFQDDLEKDYDNGNQGWFG